MIATYKLFKVGPKNIWTTSQKKKNYWFLKEEEKTSRIEFSTFYFPNKLISTKLSSINLVVLARSSLLANNIISGRQCTRLIWVNICFFVCQKILDRISYISLSLESTFNIFTRSSGHSISKLLPEIFINWTITLPFVDTVIWRDFRLLSYNSPHNHK